MDQQYQKPPGGKETKRKAQVTVDQHHQQPPGGKNISLKDVLRIGRSKSRTEWTNLISYHTDRSSIMSLKFLTGVW